MPGKQKKQFSLSLTVKIFLAAMVLISIGVFANSIMYCNQIIAETEELERSLETLYATREELREMIGSSEELNDLLSDYRKCQELINSGSVEGEKLDEYKERLEEVRDFLNASKNKDYISRIAKEELELYFADEKIFYNDKQ